LDRADTIDASAGFDPEQPHALWKSLRETCPVAEIESRDGRPTFLVSSWAGVKQVLLDPETFSSEINAEGAGRFMGPILLAMDGERHRSRRMLISHAFRASQLARWERTLIRPVIADLCAAVAPHGRAELIEDVISRFPVQVICGMCAIPAEDSPQFLKWAKDIHRGMLDETAGRIAADEMHAYLEPVVEARRAHRGDDLISDIVHAEIDGERLDEEEIFGFLRLLLPAGSESTFRATSSALLAILGEPGLLDRVLQDRFILNAVVEETLRWDVANSMVSRVVVRDAVIDGHPVPAGAGLRVVTNSANRDESRFACPGDFDIDRQSKPHIGFGLGPHQCLGQPLARLEMRLGLDQMLSSLPGLSLDPVHPVPIVTGASFRSPRALHVTFTPTAA
jgi:cytochrome P450